VFATAVLADLHNNLRRFTATLVRPRWIPNCGRDTYTLEAKEQNSKSADLTGSFEAARVIRFSFFLLRSKNDRLNYGCPSLCLRTAFSPARRLASEKGAKRRMTRWIPGGTFTARNKMSARWTGVGLPSTSANQPG
jgi:hypothetical protein